MFTLQSLFLRLEKRIRCESFTLADVASTISGFNDVLNMALDIIVEMRMILLFRSFKRERKTLLNICRLCNNI